MDGINGVFGVFTVTNLGEKDESFSSFSHRLNSRMLGTAFAFMHIQKEASLQK